MSDIDRIVLTSDPEQKARLQRKLKEYDGRLEFQAPEVDLHATYKQRILKELLEKGSVDAAVVAARLESEIGVSDGRAFSEALHIIAGYNANDLSKIRGGTGLG